MSDFPPSQNMVAKLAGVSRSTVSRVFSNHPGIPKETRDRIIKISEELGYKKNAVVSMLTAQVRSSRLRKTESTLAYITSQTTPEMMDISSTYYQFFLGAKKRAEELGYALDVIWRKESLMTSERVTKILQARGIQGLIIAPRPKAFAHISLNWSKFATASIGHELPAPKVHFAGASHYAIIDKALRMLKKYGYRRIGYAILPDSDSYSNHAFCSRYCFYRDMLPKAQQLPFFFNPMGREYPNREGLEKWLKQHQPEALICVGPDVPLWLREIGLSVPEDIAITDLCLADESGEIAGVSEMPQLIAASAVELVVEQIHHNTLGVPEYPKSVLFNGKWVDGKTLPRLKRTPEKRS